MSTQFFSEIKSSVVPHLFFFFIFSFLTLTHPPWVYSQVDIILRTILCGVLPARATLQSTTPLGRRKDRGRLKKKKWIKIREKKNGRKDRQHCGIEQAAAKEGERSKVKWGWQCQEIMRSGGQKKKKKKKKKCTRGRLHNVFFHVAFFSNWKGSLKNRVKVS